jgi:predicted RNase H-like HicB family nuclease
MKNTSKHRYEIILSWSAQDQAYIAEVPELEWCVADGKTYQEALHNVETVIAEWIETAIEKGWKIPEPKGRPLVSA